MIRTVLPGFWCLGLMCAGFAAAGEVSTPANGLVVLLTDYGADSIYVGAIKGAMYSKNPGLRIDAISNSVPPFDVLAGAYMLAEACGEFPPGTTFCCVVDPGVGTPRKRIVLESESGQRFVAPDNGLLTLVAARYGVRQLRETVHPEHWRAGAVTRTFQGRDVFGPVAAMLVGGLAMEKLGPELPELVRLDAARARVADGAAQGAVIRTDVYGNLVTNVTPQDLGQLDLKPGDKLDVTIGKQTFSAPWVSTYADVPPGEKLALVQSMGLIECAINQGSLAEILGEGLRAAVSIRKTH